MKYFLVLLTLAFAVVAFGQEGNDTALDEFSFDMLSDSLAFDDELTTDSTETNLFSFDDELTADSAAVDTMAFDDFFSPDTSATTIDMYPEDRVKELLSEEGIESETIATVELIGYTVGLDISYPLYRHGGLGYISNVSHLAVGIAVNTPYGMQLGPFEIGFGFQMGNFGFSSTSSGYELSGVYILGTANTTIFETKNALVTTQVGAGFFGESIGITVGLSFDSIIPGTPIVLRPYMRANGTLDSGVELTAEDQTPSYSWFSTGAMVSYDISTIDFRALWGKTKSLLP